MLIDNISGNYGTGTITTDAHGFTLTHEPDCRVTTGAWEWPDVCDCFISRLTTAELPDGTVTLIPEGYSTGNEAHINWLRDELVRQQKAYRRRAIPALVLALISSVVTMATYFAGKGFIEGWW